MGGWLPLEHLRIHPESLRIRTIDGLDMTTVTGFHVNYDMVSHQTYSLSIYVEYSVTMPASFLLGADPGISAAALLHKRPLA